MPIIIFVAFKKMSNNHIFMVCSILGKAVFLTKKMMSPKLIYIVLLLLACKSNQKEALPVNDLNRPVLCAAKTTDAAWYLENNTAPLFEGLGSLHYPIQTNIPEAQKYFDQGLILSYAFNHAEAARSFYYASKIDSTCAMCYWGFAYVLGPNYNGGMEPDNYQRAYLAVQKALSLVINGTQREKDLIWALSSRYTKEVPEVRTTLDSMYSARMKTVYTNYPDDPEIAALYAESIMDLHPWDLWDKQGNPKEWTPEIIEILERLLKKYPKHPGLNHFYIHAVEASYNPQRGLKSAQLFDDGLVPNAGHLVHMPSHIYIRTGDYHLGSIANIRAVEIDSQYVSACHAQGVYPLGYYPHNYHFLAATATMEGNKEWATKAAQKVSDHADRELMKDPVWGTLQHYYVIPYFVKIKFGQWNEILQMENENKDLKYPEAIRHYARGFAYLAKKDLLNAKIELESLTKFANDSSLKEITIWYINSVQTIVQIAEKVLRAEFFSTENKFDESIALLKEAVVLEDALNYNEPPDWFFSIRHHLGAVLIESGTIDEAIEVYNKDLSWWPKNGWALHGLKNAYKLKKDLKSLHQVEEQLKIVWANSDTQLTGSRIK